MSPQSAQGTTGGTVPAQKIVGSWMFGEIAIFNFFSPRLRLQSPCRYRIVEPSIVPGTRLDAPRENAASSRRAP